MTHQEITQQLPDYVLGLLAPQQVDEVARHVAACADCQAAVQAERMTGELVRQTLQNATRPEPAQLRSLMPTIPAASPERSLTLGWHKRLAPAFILLLLLAGLLFLRQPAARQPVSIFSPATATATSTNTPTATVAQQSRAVSQQAITMMIRDLYPPLPKLQELPAPHPLTPAPYLAPTPAVASSYLAAN